MDYEVEEIPHDGTGTASQRQEEEEEAVAPPTTATMTQTTQHGEGKPIVPPPLRRLNSTHQEDEGPLEQPKLPSLVPAAANPKVASAPAAASTSTPSTVRPNLSPPPAWQVNLAELNSHRTTLRTGKFRFDDGTIGDFVFVPAAYQFTSEENFLSILAALRISQKPELVFEFPKNYGVVPNLDYDESETYWMTYPYGEISNYAIWKDRDDLKFPNPDKYYTQIETQNSRVQNIIDGITDACSQVSSLSYRIFLFLSLCERLPGSVCYHDCPLLYRSLGCWDLR